MYAVPGAVSRANIADRLFLRLSRKEVVPLRIQAEAYDLSLYGMLARPAK